MEGRRNCWWKKKGKKSPFLALFALVPIVGSFHDFETIEFQDVLRKVEEGWVEKSAITRIT